MSHWRIHGAGCALADYIYADVDSTSESFRRLSSMRAGDGGLVPGQVVFTEELERFAGIGIEAILDVVAKSGGPDRRNLGGPAIVALINARQLAVSGELSVAYHGGVGRDAIGAYIRDVVAQTGVHALLAESAALSSPVTYVLSDPRAGERTFINTIGAAGEFRAEQLPDDFYRAEMIVLGGTALVPQIHDSLEHVLRRAKDAGSMTVVNTVFDFRNERLAPDRRWPLGETDDAYRSIDVLLANRTEALRLSGRRTVGEALDFFYRHGVGACAVTDGTKNVALFARGDRFDRTEGSMPVSHETSSRIRADWGAGDTTGCGDNFAGGVICALSHQYSSGAACADFASACALGIASGGFACSYLGGTYLERAPGEKRQQVGELYRAYRSQVHGTWDLLDLGAIAR